MGSNSTCVLLAAGGTNDGATMHSGCAMTPEPITVACAIATYLRDQGSNSAFVMAGGASLHLIHAFCNTPACQYLPVHYEQSAAVSPQTCLSEV